MEVEHDPAARGIGSFNVHRGHAFEGFELAGGLVRARCACGVVLDVADPAYADCPDCRGGASAARAAAEPEQSSTMQPSSGAFPSRPNGATLAITHHAWNGQAPGSGVALLGWDYRPDRQQAIENCRITRLLAPHPRIGLNKRLNRRFRKQIGGLLIRGSQVRILPGAPENARRRGPGRGRSR